MQISAKNNISICWNSLKKCEHSLGVLCLKVTTIYIYKKMRGDFFNLKNIPQAKLKQNGFIKKLKNINI